MQRFCYAGVVLAAVVFIAAVTGMQAAAVDGAPPSYAPAEARVRALERQVADMKVLLGELHASHAHLKTQVEQLTHGLGTLSAGKVARPQRPKVETLPDALPELKPLP